MKSKFITLLFVFFIVLSSTAFSQERLPYDNTSNGFHEAPRYRASEAHPLRILAYIFHPVGWVAREFIFRPMSYIASSTPTRARIFGFREPYDNRRTMCYNGETPFPNCKNDQAFVDMFVE
jgi:hypothetical protein